MNSSSSSSATNPNLQKKIVNIKYYNSNKKAKLKNFIEITNTFIQNWKKYILNLKEILKKNLSNIITDKLIENIDNITKKIEVLFSKYVNDLKNSYNSQYENTLRLYEQKIRVLFENIFNLELNKKILEESNRNLLRKEKEYELIKAKTGIVVYDNKIINNNRKENEIFILRKENSILKDVIEKQKREKEINPKEKLIIRNIKSISRSKKGSKEKSNLNQKLILKSLNLSKLKSRQKTQSLSLGQQVFRKNHHSHPKSRYPFKFDFLSSLSNSLSNSKNSKIIINSHSYKNRCRYNLSKKLFNTSNKKKSKSKIYLSNIINNIKVQKIHDIKKISPLNILKKRKIPNMNSKNYYVLNKKENFLQNNLGKKYNKNKSNNSTICLKNTKRDTSNTNNTNKSSLSRKKNNSECIGDKNNNSNLLLYSSIIKTVNNEKSKSKIISKNKQTQHKKCLSPSYGNIKYLIPNVQKKLNLGLKEIKYSKSFTRKNNLLINDINEKNKSRFDIKRLILNDSKNINLVFKREAKNAKNISKNSSRYNNSNKKIKIIRPKIKSKVIMNNIKTINSIANNSKKKIKIIKK